MLNGRSHVRAVPGFWSRARRAEPGASATVQNAVWLVGFAAIVLIFGKDSGPFYRQRPGYG